MDDLFAIGHSTGRVDLIRLEASRFARQGNILSSGPVVSLPVRTSRACNALAFCVTDPNFLAVGLDKVRNDSSLIIWDINSTYPTLSIGSFSRTSVDDTVTTLDLESSVAKIPRVDTGIRGIDGRVIQQHAPADSVSPLCFLPQSPHLLLAGITQRWLRLFDLRSPANTTNVAAKAQGIATDPFDPYRIGCFGDGQITIWDARKTLQPVLTFTERDGSADGARPRPNSSYSVIEFSSHRRGVLASMEKDATYVRFWDIMEGSSMKVEESGGDRLRDPSPLMQQPKRSWANLPWSGATAGSAPPLKTAYNIDPLVLTDTRRSEYIPVI